MEEKLGGHIERLIEDYPPDEILVAEDDEDLRDSIVEFLRKGGFVVECAATGSEAIDKIRRHPYDVILTDLKLPGHDGREILNEAMQLYPDIIVIIMTGYGTIEIAVDAMKMGAVDFISKPFEIVKLPLLMRGALERRRLKNENVFLRQQLKDKYKFSNIIGYSNCMQEVYRLIELVSQNNSTVLISGETGTGKELIARAVHFNGPRRENRLVCINCGAIPENLLEDELFGHVKGAFTGAIQTRVGRFEQAHKGTIFLDEVGNMSPSLQVKLLRVLQEREFERIGSSVPVKVDVRIMAATNADIAERVKNGSFREDLYYRLNVIQIGLPALRERREDIPLLAQHFLRKICKEMGEEPKTLSQLALRQLMAYAWPGNVRELENAVERAVILSGKRSQLAVSDFRDDIQKAEPLRTLVGLDIPDEGIYFNSVVQNIERDLILQSLKRAGGNQQKAAELLHMKRTTFLEKMRRSNVNKEDIASKNREGLIEPQGDEKS